MASQRNSSEPPGEGVGKPRRPRGPLRLLRRGQRGVTATASAVPVVEVQANVSRLTGEERCVSPVILSTAAGAAPPHPTQPPATSSNAAVVAAVVAPAHPSVSATTSSPATGGAVRSALPASKGLRGRRSSVVSRVSTVARSVAARASTYSRESRWDSSILKIRRDRTRAMEAATSVLPPASQQHLTKMKLARVRAAKKEGPPEPVVAQAPSSHKVSTEVHSKLTRIRAAKLAASVSRQLRSHRSSTRDSTARTSMFRQSRRDAARSSHRQGKARARFDPTLTAQSELPTCHESNAAATLCASRNAAMGAGARGPPQAERRGRGLAGRRTRESGLVVDRGTDFSEGWLSMRNPRESGLTVDRRTDLSDSALGPDVSRRHRESGLVVDRRTGDEERGHRCRPTAGRATARDSDLSVDAPSGRRDTGLAVDAHPGAARRHWRGRSITHRQGGTPFDGIARVSSQDELSTPPRVTFRLDSDKVESPWMQLGLELAGLELIAEEEASLDAQSKALMLAGRVRQPSASGVAKSTWLDFGQELARLSLSHEEEAALDGQSKASLRAARKLGERISRQSDSGGASWMGFGLELAELELTEEEEAELDAQSKASLRAARVVGRRESIRKSVAPSVSWMGFGLELAELELTEEEEAELDAQSKASLRAARVLSRRKNSRKSVAPSVSWMGFGLELAELDLTEEEEVELDAQSRASLRAARVVSRRKNSRKSVAPSVSWMGFGLELAELDLTEEEEVELDAQSKASLHAARVVGRRKSSRKSVAADSSWVGFGLELAELDLTAEEEVELDAQSKASLRAARVVKRRESCLPSATSASWVEFGLELADLDLDAEEEAALDAQSKASLRAARVVGRRESCRQSVSASASWVEFGLELADLELDGEEEAALDAQSKASLRAARVVGRRESCRKSVTASASWLDFGIELADLELTREQEASLDAQSRASLRAARVVGRRESCRRSCAGNPSWSGFQMDQTELGFIEEEASMKEHSRTPLKLATDASQLQHPTASAWNDFGMQEGLELSEEETAASAQAHAVTRPASSSIERATSAHDIAPATSWLGFGLELAGLELSAEEEGALDAQAQAALHSARVVKARGGMPDVPAKSSWLGFGLELAGMELSAEEEGALDAQAKAALQSARVVKARGEMPDVPSKSSWLGFGLELAGLGLSAEEEAALDAQAQAALHSARVVKARGEPPDVPAKPSWVGFGLELAALGLSADEEAALDAQAQAALHSAQVVKARGEMPDVPAKPSWVGFGLELAALGLSADEEAALDVQAQAALQCARVVKARGETPEGMVKSAWVGFGLELAALELSADEETALDAQARAALQSARVIKARGEPPEPMAKSAWVGFGLELAALGLNADEEAALDVQAQSALRSARVIKARGEPTEGTVKSSWVGFGLELAGLGLHADEEEALDAQARTALHSARVIKARGELPEGMVKSSWLGFGLELAGLGLNADEEEALDAQARAALLSARLLKAKLVSQGHRISVSSHAKRHQQGNSPLKAEDVHEPDTSRRTSSSIKKHEERSSISGSAGAPIQGADPRCRSSSTHMEPAITTPSIMHDELPLGSSRATRGGVQIDRGAQLSVHVKAAPTDMMHEAAQRVKQPSVAASSCSSVLTTGVHGRPAITRIGDSLDSIGEVDSEDEQVVFECDGSQIAESHAISDPRFSSRAISQGLDYIDGQSADAASPSAALSAVHARAVQGRPPLPIGASLDESIGEVDLEDEQAAFGSDCTASPTSTSLAKGLSMSAQTAAPSPSSAVTLDGAAEVMPGTSISSPDTPLDIEDGADAPSNDGAPSGEQTILESAADAAPQPSSREALEHVDSRAQDAACLSEGGSAVHARDVQGRPPLPVGASLDESIGDVDSEDEQVTFSSACAANPTSTPLAEGLSMSAQAAAPSPSSAVTLGGTTDITPATSISSQDTPFHIHDGAPSEEQAILASAADGAPQTSSREAPEQSNNRTQNVASPPAGGAALAAVHARCVQRRPPLPVGASLDESIGEVDLEDEQVTFESACTASPTSTVFAEGLSMPAQAAAPSPSSAVTLGSTAEVMPGSSVPSQDTPFHIQRTADAPTHDSASSEEQAILASAADDVDAQSSSREALEHIDSRIQDVASPPEDGAPHSTVHARAAQGRPPLPVGASLDESIGEVDSEDEQVTFGSACTASPTSTAFAEGLSMPAQAAAPSPSSAVTLGGTTDVMPGSRISSQDTPFHIQCRADAPTHDSASSEEQSILASAADDINPQFAVEESPNDTQNVDVHAPSPDVASSLDELGSISAVYASVVNGPSGALIETTSMSNSSSRVMEHEITLSDSDSRPVTSCCEDYPPAAAPSSTSAVLEGQNHTFIDLALSRVVLSQESLTPESVIDDSASVIEHATYVPPFGQRDISSPSLVVPDKGSASKGRQGGFNEQEKVALVRHVKWALKNNPLVADIEKIDPHSNDIYKFIAASVLPCLFIHHVDELAIDVRALNVPGDQPLDQSSRLQNHTLCINAATSIGCGVRGLRPQHLDNAEHHSHAILQLLWNLTKYELLLPLRGDRSAFSNFMLPEESMHTFIEVSATELLRRWLTSRIQGYIRSHPQQLLVSSNFVVSDFGTDLADSIALAIVLKQLSSASTRPDELRKYRIEQRAACVVDAARDAGVEAFQVEAEDITSAQPRLLLAFVAAIYHKFPRAQSTKNKKVDGGREEREERSLRFWMISIGISIQSLPLDCRTGVPLLQAIELLKPGTVNWRKAYGNPTSVFHCVENCNQACDLCTRALALSMVGIGGKDIADGKRKLILAIVWQLMRLHTLKFLRELGADEAGILDWANDRVRHVDGLQYICGFSDPLIGKGVFLLHLLHSVAPECVSPDKILAGETAEECQLNARYAISCAHKMGCTLFAVWEDVVEVLPKMVMVLLAAVMKVDMVRCGTIEPDAHGLLSDSDLLYNTRPSRELSFDRVEHRGDDSMPGGSVPSNPFVVRLQAPTCVPPPPPAPLELDEPSAEMETNSVYPCEQLEAECASPSCSSAPQPATEDPTSPGVTSPSHSAPFTIRVARPLQELPELGSPSLELPGPSSLAPSPTSTTAPLSQRIRPADRTESFRRGGRPAPSPPESPASVGLSSPASELPVSRDPPSASDVPASHVLPSPNASDPESSRPAARVAHFATSCPSTSSAALPESADHETQELQDGVTQPGYWSAHSQSPTGKSTSRAPRSFFSRFAAKSNNRRLRFAVRRKKPHDAAYASFLRDGAMDNLSGSTSVTAEVPTGAADGYKDCSVPYDPILGSWHAPAPRNTVNPQQLLQVGRRMRFLSQIHRFSSTPQLYHASLDTESRTL